MLLLIPLIVAGIILLIIGVIFLVGLLLTKGAWGRLVGRYSTTESPAGRVLQRQTITVGAVTYERRATVGIADEGLYLKIGRKAVLIPWNDFEETDQTMLRLQAAPVLAVGKPSVASITAQKDLFARMREKVPVCNFTPTAIEASMAAR
jgi:hypothetical protein